MATHGGDELELLPAFFAECLGVLEVVVDHEDVMLEVGGVDETVVAELAAKAPYTLVDTATN
jgi:hypothetical protein